MNEREKKRHYNDQRLLQIENGIFTPLVETTAANGAMARMRNKSSAKYLSGVLRPTLSQVLQIKSSENPNNILLPV